MDVLRDIVQDLAHTLYFLQNRPWISVISLLIGSISLYIILVTTYRLTFHPLAKYPGPLLSKITDWSMVLQASSGNRHLESLREHEIYGPIVRIGPNTLSLNTASALHSIYASRKANVQKADWYRTIDAPSGAFSTHSEIDRDKHAFRRRVLYHAFSDSALRSAESFVVDALRKWCRHLGEGADRIGSWTRAKKMSDWCTYLGFDIMGELTFGESFNCMESEEHRYVPGLMMQSTKFVYIFGLLPFIKLIRPLMGTPIMDFLVGPLAADSSKYIAYANTQMANRLAVEHNNDSKRPRKDFMHYLINAVDSQTGKSFTTTELNSDSSLLISAGADTTAITLSAALFYLLHYPAALAAATDEIRVAFPTREDIRSGLTLKSLSYLRACIDETLRLSPPVPSLLPREVLSGGLAVNGEAFPPGTTVGVSAYVIHHNPAYYPDPHTFRPERWLAPTLKEEIERAQSAFCPFSLGSRGCIGKSVAYLEITLALACLLWEYDMQLPRQGERDPSGEGRPEAKHWGRRKVQEYQLIEHFLAEREGPMVQFKQRQV